MAEPKRIRVSCETASESAPRGGDTGLIQQLLAKEEECRQKDKALKEKDEVIREKAAIIQAQQAEIQRLRDQLAVSQKVS